MCSSCSNWVDFVKSGCEKSLAEVQTDSFRDIGRQDERNKVNCCRKSLPKPK